MTWVLFDYGGVISYPPADEDLALLAAAADAPVPALMEVYWAWRRAYDLAELDAPGYWRQVGRALGRGYGEAEIAELIRLDQATWLRLQAGTVALIEQLAAAGRPLALLSNAPDELADTITELPLADVLNQPFVASLLPPLLERHKQSLELIRSRSKERDGTIFFDITDHPIEGFNKFIPYYLHPHATYSIGLSKSSFRTKVAVGSNPWTKADPAKMVNLAQICERYGGGGHARVGAISFPPDQEDRARAAAAEIVAELRAKNPLA